MDSIPRRWVLKPLSPSLQPSDLRPINVQPDDSVFFNESISVVRSQSSVYVENQSDSSADVVVAEARQVAVSQDGSDGDSTSDELPISPCSSSASSHNGFYSFVEDPFCPEAEQNEAWMVSPQRQTKLSTLKEQTSFKLQTYTSQRKPESLFQDQNEDSKYEIDAKHGFRVVGEEEERQLRNDIIRNQAPKKSPLFDQVDASQDTSKLIKGFSISFSPLSTTPKQAEVDSGAIDEEQINFSAAREQFVKMEKNKLDPIIRPRKIHLRSTPGSSREVLVQDKSVRKEDPPFRPTIEDARLSPTVSCSRQSFLLCDTSLDESSSKSNTSTMQEKYAKTEASAFNPTIEDARLSPTVWYSRESSLFDDASLDNLSQNVGVSLSSTNGLASDQENTTNQFSIDNETPIEREIRIAQEREEHLRRSRGLQHSVSRVEMVEIKTKRLQSPLPLTQVRTKDKGRVSFIFQEIQRMEEAIKQEGARQEFNATRQELANRSIQEETIEEQANTTQSNEDFAVKRAIETLKDFESIGEAWKFDDVDNAVLPQRQESYQPSGTKTMQGYKPQDVNSTRPVHTFQDHKMQEASTKITKQRESEQEQGYMAKYVGDTNMIQDPNYHEFAGKVKFEKEKSIGERWQSSIQERNIVESQNDQKILERREQNGYKSLAERSRVSLFNEEVIPLPCCPHKHPEESVMIPKWDSPIILKQASPTRANPEMVANATSRSWRESQELTGLQYNRQGAPDFIEKEIEEALRREQELKEQREARKSQVYSPQSLVEQADKMAVSQFYSHTKTDKLGPRLPSSPQPSIHSLVSPQPWTSSQPPLVPQSPSGPGPIRTASLPIRGLTETLLQDFEERRSKLKLEESTYAGIQPIDAVNNEVVESTRVTRHKNQRALQWEAGVFANEPYE